MFEIIRSSKSGREMNNQTILQTPTYHSHYPGNGYRFPLSFFHRECKKESQIPRALLDPTDPSSTLNLPINRPQKEKKTSFNPYTYASRYAVSMCRENIIWKPITYHLDLTSLLALSKWSTTRSILGILRFDHSGTLDTSHRKINACNFSLPPPFPSPNNEHNSCIIASHPFTILTPPILLKSIPHPPSF